MNLEQDLEVGKRGRRKVGLGKIKGTCKRVKGELTGIKCVAGRTF